VQDGERTRGADRLPQRGGAIDDEQEGPVQVEPRSRRSVSNARPTVAFSVLPSRSARTCF
jgi:hypothetical protein